MATSHFNLLYVCDGNDARSPLAVACTQAAIADDRSGVVWHVDSAGTEALEGGSVRHEALAAAQSIGIDLSEHRSTQLQAHNCERPDLILAMSWEQVSNIWSLVPQAWDKVFTIKEFVYWAKKAPVRPPILFPNKLAEMRDKIVQAHAMRKRARADYGFWGGIRPQELNLIDPTGKGPEAWEALAKAMQALTADVVTLLRGPEVVTPIAPKRTAARAKRPASRTRAKTRS
jgi:protein-tyrosine-phosphatase